MTPAVVPKKAAAPKTAAALAMPPAKPKGGARAPRGTAKRGSGGNQFPQSVLAKLCANYSANLDSLPPPPAKAAADEDISGLPLRLPGSTSGVVWSSPTLFPKKAAAAKAKAVLAKGVVPTNPGA